MSGLYASPNRFAMPATCHEGQQRSERFDLDLIGSRSEEMLTGITATE
jgi:hypothetical protein